jgi:hypothetical protein
MGLQMLLDKLEETFLAVVLIWKIDCQPTHSRI